MIDGATTGLTTGLSNSLAHLVERTFLGLMQNSKEGVAAVKTRLVIGFERYITTTLSQCINVKTLISNSQPIGLEKAYEPVNLKSTSNQIIHIDDFIDDFIDDLENFHNRSIITATLGAGKSFTMRYIFSTLARVEVIKRVPVFIELRNIDFEKENIISYASDQLSIHSSFVTENSLKYGLKSGVFTFLLDGFDEIPIKNRKIAEKQILKISNDYPDIPIIVSSRPDSERFLSWHAFSEHNIMPLTLDQLERMLSRIDYNDSDKETFLKRVKGGLFKTHEKLLSNPLLASMMLLTFREFQDIPSKMHVFYGTAFDVLFRRHDTIKPDYHREFETSLELDAFKKVFMTFCFASYVDKQHGFVGSSFKKYARTSFDYEGVDVDEEAFQNDLIRNICIMQREAENILFIHRSFQEYFTALFLSKRSIPEIYQFINHIVAEADGSSACAAMLVDIDSEEFERKFLIQRLKEFDTEAEEVNTDRKKIDFLSSTYVVGRIGEYGDFYISPWRWTERRKESNYHFITAISEHYSFNEFYSFSGRDAEWVNFMPKEMRNFSSLRIVKSSDIPIKAAKKAGIVAYATKIISQAKHLSKELQDRHEKKRRLLSNSLKRQ